jgi:hypothetical protein
MSSASVLYPCSLTLFLCSVSLFFPGLLFSAPPCFCFCSVSILCFYISSCSQPCSFLLFSERVFCSFFFPFLSSCSPRRFSAPVLCSFRVSTALFSATVLWLSSKLSFSCSCSPLFLLLIYFLCSFSLLYFCAPVPALILCLSSLYMFSAFVYCSYSLLLFFAPVLCSCSLLKFSATLLSFCSPLLLFC